MERIVEIVDAAEREVLAHTVESTRGLRAFFCEHGGEAMLGCLQVHNLASFVPQADRDEESKAYQKQQPDRGFDKDYQGEVLQNPMGVHGPEKIGRVGLRHALHIYKPNEVRLRQKMHSRDSKDHLAIKRRQ